MSRAAGRAAARRAVPRAAGLVLTVRPAEAAAFAPYGWLVDAGGGAGARPVNGGSSLRLDGLGELALTAEGGTPCLALFRARARAPHGPWRTLERHRLGTQTFIPLGGARCVVLAATGAERPEPDSLAAFVLAGHQGYTLHAGTWHHALLALDDGDFAVIERRGPQEDCEIARLAAPVRLVLP